MVKKIKVESGKEIPTPFFACPADMDEQKEFEFSVEAKNPEDEIKNKIKKACSELEDDEDTHPYMTDEVSKLFGFSEDDSDDDMAMKFGEGRARIMENIRKASEKNPISAKMLSLPRFAERDINNPLLRDKVLFTISKLKETVDALYNSILTDSSRELVYRTQRENGMDETLYCEDVAETTLLSLKASGKSDEEVAMLYAILKNASELYKMGLFKNI